MHEMTSSVIKKMLIYHKKDVHAMERNIDMFQVKTYFT